MIYICLLFLSTFFPLDSLIVSLFVFRLTTVSFVSFLFVKDLQHIADLVTVRCQRNQRGNLLNQTDTCCWPRFHDPDKITTTITIGHLVVEIHISAKHCRPRFDDTETELWSGCRCNKASVPHHCTAVGNGLGHISCLQEANAGNGHFPFPRKISSCQRLTRLSF